MAVNWRLFRAWEIKRKKLRLKNLSSQKAFAVFEELYSLQESFPPEELEKSRQRRFKNLIKWRKKMDSLKGGLK